jgi:hypothetical protein
MNPVFYFLLRVGKARLARALNLMEAPKPPRRDKLDKKSQEMLFQALLLLEHLKDQPELSPNDLISFGASAAAIGHFAPFSELSIDHRDVASRGGSVSGVARTKTAQLWHTEARIHMAAVEKENQGLSPRKLGKLVMPLCKTAVDIEAMAKFIRSERKMQPGSS